MTMRNAATMYAMRSGFARIASPKRRQRIPFIRNEEPNRERGGIE